MFINMWAVLVAAIAMFAVGALWYSVLFGKQWMKLSNITMPDPRPSMASMWPSYAKYFIATLVTAFVLSKLISWFCNGSMNSALKLALMIWLGFVAMLNLSGVFWESKPWALYFLNTICTLVTIIVGTLIIVAWK